VVRHLRSRLSLRRQVPSTLWCETTAAEVVLRSQAAASGPLSPRSLPDSGERQ
jgi:hypothetical protein